MPTLAPGPLSNFAAAIFRAVGAPSDHARTVADHLVESNLAGHDSHGVIRIPQYVQYVRTGLIDPAARPVLVSEAPAGALMDGQHAFGQVGVAAALNHAQSLARRTGVAAVSLRNCGHSGRLGAYTAAAAKEGFIALMMVNNGGGGHNVAPFGGAGRRLSTNPLSIGAPSDGPFPIVVDIATSVAPEGKLRVAYQRKNQVPDGWLVDHEGRPTNDPAKFYEPPVGALLPMGGPVGHKGYALAFLIDILAGALSGAGCCRAGVVPGTTRDGVLLVAMDVRKFGPWDGFLASVRSLIDHVKSCPPAPGFSEVLTPGEVEHRQAERRTRDGIEIEDATWEAIGTVAKELRVKAP